MPSSRKSLASPAAAGEQAQALAMRMVALQADAGLTIAMRMPILMKGAMGDHSGQREATKAVMEKVSAVMESGFAAGCAAAAFWWGVALNPMAQIDLAEASAKVANQSLEPFSRRTRANAARLSRRR
jgi:hypothetical protein